MNRRISDRDVLKECATQFCSVLEKHTKYIIVSGYVAIATGRTRGTEDIDVIIEKISQENFEKLHQDLTKNGFVCMQSDNASEVFSYLEDASVRYTWKDKPLPEMELKCCKDLLDREQINNRKKLPLTGTILWFSSIEANIAFKEQYLKSDKDIEDAKHLRIIYEEEIQESEIERWKKLIQKFRL